jgi:hypothetical protein
LNPIPSFSIVFIKIPPIRNPLSTKKNETPSKLTIFMIDTILLGRKLILCVIKTIDIAKALIISNPKIRLFSNSIFSPTLLRNLSINFNLD